MDKFSSVHYYKYLNLDKILGSQNLRSAELGNPAHDEMLFIIIHQIYELWFKQINHEMQSILKLLGNDKVNEPDISICISRIERIIEIQKIMTEQLRVLETLTPLDFLDFRSYLIPASGFQSYQFRLCEIAMGLKMEMRTTYNQKIYSNEFTEEQKSVLLDYENGKSLFDLVEKWLSRMPFYNTPSWDFKEKYLQAVENMVENERVVILTASNISDDDKRLRIQMLEQNQNYINNSLDFVKHKESIKNNVVRLSYESTIAALMINLYRDEPLLRNPFLLISKIVEMDEMFSLFRYRHAQMVMRIIGKKMGTGGSSGYDYLMKTVINHQVFRDLHNISTLMIPRSEIPELDQDIKDKLNFVFR